MTAQKGKRLLKRTLAVLAGLAMAFGAFALPESTFGDTAITAYADNIFYKDNVFSYQIRVDRDVETMVITGMVSHGDTVEIPSVIKHKGVEYPVHTIEHHFLENDMTVKKVIVPESVKVIEGFFLDNSSVEEIVLPDGLEKIGDDFVTRCTELKSVEYNGTGIKRGNMGMSAFKDSNTSGLINDKGAICLGNWLIRYRPEKGPSTLRIADLGSNGIPVENLAWLAVYNVYGVETVDLEGVKYIDKNNFADIYSLTDVINTDDVEEMEDSAFKGTPWYEGNMTGDLKRIGKCVVYYKTDSKTIDLSADKLKGTKSVCDEALVDCANAEVLLCDSDCTLGRECFYEDHDQSGPEEYYKDPLPIKSTYKIAEVYLDGKKLDYQRILEDPAAHEWLKTNFASLKGSEFIKNLVTEKTKVLFEQLDITNYGMNNDKIGTLTPTEEFYIRLKIHNYISIYDYDHHRKYDDSISAFLLGGKMTCTDYAQLSAYLLECAGVETKGMHWANEDHQSGFGCHYWNSTKIGDEWFEFDDGWNAQNNYHYYKWFGLSSSDIYSKDKTDHEYNYAYDSWHLYESMGKYKTERVTAERTLGDINGDDCRNYADADLLWAYLKGESDTIDEKKADIDFDGKVDITDGVILSDLVNGKAIDPDNVPIDGLAPGFKVVFLNGDDYDDIKYLYTDREGNITLPDDLYEPPEGMLTGYDIGKAGETVRVTKPYTIIRTKWTDSKDIEDKGILGDVNGDKKIDIEDAVSVIQQINGVKRLTDEQVLRADVSKDDKIDIDDAVMIINYINGNKAF